MKRSKNNPIDRQRVSRTPVLEALEPRQLMAAYVVDSLADTVDGDHGFGQLTLREAIVLANANPGSDAISFAPGLNGGTIALIGGELALTDSLSISGPGSDLLRIDAGGASRVLRVELQGSVSISGIALSGGAWNDWAVYQRGDGSCELQECTISGNEGGGIGWWGTGALTVERCTIDHNLQVGILNFGVANIEDSVISDNGLNTRGMDAGGEGIFNRGTLTIVRSEVSGNHAPFSWASAGGITTYGGVVTIIDCSVSNNKGRSGGGGVSNVGGTLTVTRSTIADNSVSAVGGGGVFNRNGTFDGKVASATITDSTISGNSSREAGGGIANAGGTMTVFNSTVSGNRAAEGCGGVYNTGDLSMFNCTVTDNRFERLSYFGGGGGVWAEAGSTRLVSTIVVGNIGLTYGVLVRREVGGTLVSGSINNLIGDANSAGGLIDGVDGNLLRPTARLNPLADNGGPTLTHALPEDSPAVDTGTNASGLVFDQRGPGFSRTIGSATDIGAFEFGHPTAMSADEFLQKYAAAVRSDSGLVNGDWIANTLFQRVADVATSDAYWGARNHWFQDSRGDVWALWHGGDVHKSKTLPGQHEWVLTNLTDAAGLSGTMNFAPGSLSAITTGWNAFSIQGIRDGELLALWWSPAGSAGDYVDLDGSTKRGAGLGLRGNGWVLSSITGAAVTVGGAIGSPPTAFLAYTESQGNGRTEFDPRPTRMISNTGMTIVVVDTGLRVYTLTFSVSQRHIAGALPDLNASWVLEPMREVPSIADLGLSGQVDQIERAYVELATR